MKKQFYIYAGFSILFFFLAFWQEQKNTKENNLQQYATQIQQTLQWQENEVSKIANELTLPNAVPEESVLQERAKQPFTLLIFESGNLKSWTNNQIIVEQNINEGFQNINENFYFISKKNITENKQSVALFPIKLKYKKSYQEELESFFIADDNIPKEVSISATATPFKVESSTGATFYLDSKDNPSNSDIQYRLFVLFLLATVFLCALVNHVANELIEQMRPDYGLIFLFLAVAGIMFLINYLGFNNRFELLPLFKYTLSSTSVGDMLINIFLLLWLIIFFYKDVRPWNFENLKLSSRLCLLFVFYVAIVSGLLITIYFHKSLIFNEKENFDFENLFYIQFSNVVTIMSLLLLWVVLFLFNYRIMKNAKRLKIPLAYRIAVLLGVLILVSVSISENELNVNRAMLALFLFGLVMFVDFFVDNESSYFPWVLTWLIVFASTSAIFLYKYKRDSDIEELKTSVRKLSLEDTKAITKIDEVINLVKKEIDTLKNIEQINKRVGKIFHSNDYLADNYRMELSDSLQRGVISPARKLSDSLFHVCYSAQIPRDSNHFYRLEVFRQERMANSDMEYNTSVLTEPYRGIKYFDKIDYAVFKDGVCDEQKGDWYTKIEDLNNIPSFGTDARLTKWNPSESEVIGHYENNTIIVARHKYDGRQKVVFLFAYLYIFLAGMTFIIAVINTLVGFIDGFQFPRNWTINFKVHATIVGLVIFACIIVAFITIIYSTSTTEERHKTQLYQKIEAVSKHTQNVIKEGGSQSIDFQNLTKKLSSVHKIDVNFYDTTGKLLSSTDKIVFNKNLKAPLINSVAFQRLTTNNEYSFQIDDQVGNFTYKSGFVQVLKDNKIVAFMELPYYSRELLKQSDLSDLMGMLMTVYVLLLLPTIIFAYSTTKVIMKPLQEVAEKLREVEFGVTPTKIEWDSKDELGDLIREYNAMLFKLEESARQIKASAKESAWKVMASQVAHDIRNPLTPLKLSVQMLAMMSIDLDYESLKAYIKKTTRTLEEQINHMDSIASNFLAYSQDKKQQSELEEIEFNDFVEVNAALFSNNEHPNAVLNIVTPPDKRIFVKVDRTQITRVLNNLIKNAIQAIPDNREGRVDVFVYEQGKKVITRISDNGVGIPQEQMEKIFLPNFTTRGTGSGIGLAVSNRMVMDAQGQLWCESVLGQGSDFFIELPILRVE